MKFQSCSGNPDLLTHLFKLAWDFNTTPSIISLKGETRREACIFFRSGVSFVSCVSGLCPGGQVSCPSDELDLVFTNCQLCGLGKEP